MDQLPFSMKRNLHHHKDGNHTALMVISLVHRYNLSIKQNTNLLSIITFEK